MVQHLRWESNNPIRAILQISGYRLQQLFQLEGISKCVAVCKPFLEERHLHARLAFAHAHAHWTEDDWSKVIWSDETSIALGKLAQRRYVARAPGDKYKNNYLVPAFKEHKRSVMIWSCSVRIRLGPMEYFPKGSINANTYTHLLQHTLLPFLDEMKGLFENLVGERNFTFQQDNAPIDKAKKIMEFMQDNNLKTLQWPANSPDLNLIEHIWPRMKHNIFTMWSKLKGQPRHGPPSDPLGNLAVEAWTASEEAFLKSLVLSMPRRIQAVIEAQGGHTKY